MPPVTSPAPSRRSADKQAAILAAAADLVERYGYGSVSIEGIAARAGVAKQTIYRWWPGKPALFVDVYASLIDPAALAADGPDPRTRLTRLLARLFRRYRTTPAARILAGLIGAAATDPEARDAVRAGLVLGRAGIVADALAAAGLDSEVPADRDPAIVNGVVIALVWQQAILDPDGFSDARAEAIATQALAAGGWPTDPRRP